MSSLLVDVCIYIFFFFLGGGSGRGRAGELSTRSLSTWMIALHPDKTEIDITV